MLQVMLVLAKMGYFEVKQIPQARLTQLAAAYVGYIVLCNLSLKVNTVGFYQVRRLYLALLLSSELLARGRRCTKLWVP